MHSNFCVSIETKHLAQTFFSVIKHAITTEVKTLHTEIKSISCTQNVKKKISNELEIMDLVNAIYKS